MSRIAISKLRTMINKIIKVEIVDQSEELDEYILAYLRNVNNVDAVGKLNDDKDECKELRIKLGSLEPIILEGQVRAAIVKFKKRKEKVVVEA